MRSGWSNHVLSIIMVKLVFYYGNDKNRVAYSWYKANFYFHDVDNIESLLVISILAKVNLLFYTSFLGHFWRASTWVTLCVPHCYTEFWLGSVLVCCPYIIYEEFKYFTQFHYFYSTVDHLWSFSYDNKVRCRFSNYNTHYTWCSNPHEMKFLCFDIALVHNLKLW